VVAGSAVCLSGAFIRVILARKSNSVSSSAKADDPVRREACDWAEKPRRTGPPGQAGR
jgi:hypothetical protein